MALTLVPLAASAAWAQAPDAQVFAFDVASIRLSPQQADHLTLENIPRVRVFPGGRLTTVNTPIRELVLFAYGLEDFELTDALPGALAKTTFDINALSGADIRPVPRGQVGPIHLMMQALLRDRFKLVVRREQRQADVLVMTRVRPDRLGPGLQVAKVACGVVDTGGLLRAEDGKPCFWGFVNDVLHVKGLAIREFASQLEVFLMKKVVDRTGLEGVYDMTMTVNAMELPVFSRLWSAAGRQPRPSDAPALSTALREQLGLRMSLEPENVTHYVIEYAEMPTEN